MDKIDAISALAALAQPTRLDIFQLLVGMGAEGMPAGELASRLAVPQNTLSAHLSVLSRAGLVAGERRSRFIIYRADIARLQDMMLFLLKDCCGGKADICAPLVADLTSCKGLMHD
jgi:DNA-binding transcriptional ArsR family regulator